jgi:hypothetical protein
MCELCNGSRAVQEFTGISVSFRSCPVCGPMNPVEWQQYWTKVEQRIEAAEKSLEVKEGML